jgi:hypothetical protein
MVKRHKAERRDLAPAQNLLAVLEQTQQVLEHDLAQLMQTGQRRALIATGISLKL